MIFTQRQLETLLKSQGKIILPYRAKLSPAAQDWVRHQKVSIGFGEVTIDFSKKDPTAEQRAFSAKHPSRFVWWSDGPDGVVKAAIGMASKEANLSPMAILADASKVLSAIRQLVLDVKSGDVTGGVLIVKNAGLPLVYANQNPHLRAIPAGTLASIEESIESLAANVLVIEHEKWSLLQLRNMLTKFCMAQRVIKPQLAMELDELRKL